MAIPTIPTAEEIKNRIVSDLDSKPNQTTPALPKAFNKALAGAIAGLILLLYQSVLWTYRQAFPSTADELALKLLGALVNIDILPATFAVLTVDIPGTNGYTPPEGTQFRSSSNVVYSITTTDIIAAGVASCSITCQTSGDIGNLPNGTELAIVSPDPQLTGIATVTATETDGDDQESLDSYRARVLAAYRNRRTGGSPADYQQWGLETPNFDWVSPLDSPTTAGEVEVYGKVNNQPDGIPTGDQLNQLRDSLILDPVTGLRTRHPIGPDVTTLPISRFEFDITIFLQNGTAQMKSDISAAVINDVETKQPYNEAIDLVKDDTISEGSISDAGNDIANPQGATVTAVILSQVTPPLIIQSYQLFGGIWGKVRNITYTDVL